MNRRIEIAGGGLAGLTLGIGLLQRNIPVTVWEAGTYPRHRVCGEFISGQGLETLDRLGLTALLRENGASHAYDTLFAYGKRATPVKLLPGQALCLSRYDLDRALAEEFRRLGGELRTHSRWKGELTEGVVMAVGRRIEKTNRQPLYLGLKVHARQVRLVADLEIHFVPSGYVGLCRLPKGIVNVCGLFQMKDKNPDLAKQWRSWLCGPEGSLLRSRLSTAEFGEDSFRATAGFALHPKRAVVSEAVQIGDALTMIPPLTGNGMSMAFESAELAVDSIARFSLGEIGWAEVRLEIARACDERFERRLRWASRLHRLLFYPIPRKGLMWIASHSDRVWGKLYGLTR